jgi:hypothetical protein
MRRTRRARVFSTLEGKDRSASRWLEPLLGLLLGLALGLWVAWGFAPRAQVDPSPAALRSDYKDEYRLLIASAYAATGDLGRARVRLALLADPDPAAALLEQSERALAAGASQQTVFLLSLLAEAVQQPLATQTSALETPSIPAAQPTATPPPFRLVVQQAVCNAALPAGLVQIEVRDAAKQPLPGIAILATWEGGQQRLHTGLKPELGAGYADFVMSPGLVYDVQIPPSGKAVKGLSLPVCTDEQTGNEYGGGYLIIFEQE